MARSKSPRRRDDLADRNGEGLASSAMAPVPPARSPSHLLLEKDRYGYVRESGFIDELYSTHTFLALGGVLAALLAFSLASDQHSRNERIKVGMVGTIIFFLCYMGVQGRDGSLVRPHPALWRVAHGMGVVYVLLLVCGLFLHVHDIRDFMRWLDPSVPKELDLRSYGEDCRVYIPGSPSPFSNLSGAVDVFVVAHFLGWMAKALLFRDWVTLIVLSIGFEIIESTFQHILPNYNECWWDHLLLDIFGCNAIGMFLGMAATGYLEGREYDWMKVRLDRATTYKGVFKRLVLQFTPFEFLNYHWSIFDDRGRWLQWLAMCAVMLLAELNCFMLKHMLYTPTSHWSNVGRLLVVWLVAYPGVHEYYLYCSETEVTRGLSLALQEKETRGRIKTKSKSKAKSRKKSNDDDDNDDDDDSSNNNNNNATSTAATTAPNRRRMGQNTWLAVVLVVVEFVLCCKMATEDKSAFSFVRALLPAPYIVLGWGVSLTATLLFTVLYFRSGVAATKASTFKPESAWGSALRILFHLMWAPLLFILAVDCWRTAAYHPPPLPGHTPGW